MKKILILVMAAMALHQSFIKVAGLEGNLEGRPLTEPALVVHEVGYRSNPK